MLAQLLSLSSSTSIQRVDDCALFVVDAAFIGFILTRHFFFCGRTDFDQWHVCTGLRRSAFAGPITRGNVPLCGALRQIAWSRL